ncbi:MAG: hypothetical protein ACKVOR_07150 [Flavobacteriales bacterium]
MKNNLILIAAAVITLSSCFTPQYLPHHKAIDVGECGSYMVLNRNKGPQVKGELITADSTKLVVRSQKTDSCITIAWADIKTFRMHYAQAVPYGWTIPVYMLFTFLHGWFSVISMPVNLIVTLAVVISAERAYAYYKEEITIDELRMFARFPQGLPEGVTLKDVKRPPRHGPG